MAQSRKDDVDLRRDPQRRVKGRRKTSGSGAIAKGRMIEPEQLKPQIGAPEKLLLNSGMNSLLPPPERQAKWNLTEAEDVFAREYVETGDFKRATVAAAITDKTAQTYLTRERVWNYIEKYLSLRLTSGAVVGYSVVLDLAKKAKTEGTRLKAAQWLFDKFENRLLRDAGIIAARDAPSDINALQERLGELSKMLNLNIQVNLPGSVPPNGNGRTIESDRND